jgi:hypothetical protein
MPSQFRTARRLGLPLLLAPMFLWGGVAMAAPFGAANATCTNLYNSGYNPPAFLLVPAASKPNLVVDDCYPPYGNQIPNVNNTEDESGNLNFPAPNPPAPKPWNQISAWNTTAVGYDDNQGRVIYQPLVFNYQNYVTNGYANHEILFNGDIAGTAPNCLVAGCPVQQNGTNIVDVTNPAKPVPLYMIPAGPTPGDPATEINDGAQMVRVCAGDQLNTDAGGANPAHHVYLLRENGNGGSHGTQEIWDVTNPAAPTFLSIIATNLQATHKSWWECDTGIAYIVAGKTADNFGTLQHMYIYNIKNAATPVFIRQYAIAGGQHPASANTGNCTNAPSATSCYEGTTNPPGSLHGPISMGNLVNRVYNPWGIGSDGVIQIVARDKLIYGCYTSPSAVPVNAQGPGYLTGTNPAASTNCAAAPGSGLNPTQADSLFPQISVVTMQPTQGGHSSMPILGVPIPEEQASYLTSGYPVGWDLVMISSEGTANNCSGQDAHEAWIETVGIFQMPSGFASAPGGFANLGNYANIDGAISGGPNAKYYNATDEQQWPEATMSVPEQPGGFCAKGFRFGAHAVTEAIFPPYYGKIQCVSWFGGGARCWDIRDPKNPLPISYWSAAPTANTIATPGTYFPPPGGVPVATDRNATDQNYVEFDDRGYLYVVDRAGTGTAILQFTGGTPFSILNAKTVPPGTCPSNNCGEAN